MTSAHRVKVEEKPEVRKADGVYYTPQYIVNYIVENTIYNTLIAFETGVLSKEETLVRLKVRKLYNQMTFKTEGALSFLRYNGFWELTP
jgi:hypothetical protein